MIKLKSLVNEAVPNILASNIKELDILYTDRGKFYKMQITDKGNKTFKIASIQDADTLLDKLGVTNKLPRVYDYTDVDLVVTELPKNIKVSHSDSMDIR
jgi:hypothetical protein